MKLTFGPMTGEIAGFLKRCIRYVMATILVIMTIRGYFSIWPDLVKSFQEIEWNPAALSGIASIYVFLFMLSLFLVRIRIKSLFESIITAFIGSVGSIFLAIGCGIWLDINRLSPYLIMFGLLVIFLIYFALDFIENSPTNLVQQEISQAQSTP